MLLDKFLQLRVGPSVTGLLALGKILNELIRPEAGLAGLAVHQRIVKAAHMAAGNPHLAVHQNRAVQPGVVFAFLHKLLPPGLLHIVLQLHTQRTVIPGVCQAAVDLGSGKNEAPAFAQGHQLVHRQFRHDSSSPFTAGRAFPPASFRLNTGFIIGFPGPFVKGNNVLLLFSLARVYRSGCPGEQQYHLTVSSGFYKIISTENRKEA